MKYKKILIFICVWAISNCSMIQQSEIQHSQTQLEKISKYSETPVGELENVYSEASGDYKTYIFKTTLQANLRARVWEPAKDVKRSQSAIIFFYGGGWVRGTIEHFSRQASYFASIGIVAITVDYRVTDIHGVTPAESLSDAKSAIRWLRGNASKFGIQPNRIIAAGGSAGGHLVAASAVIEGFNDSQDDLSVSTVANALVLFNPVIDNSPTGYGNKKVANYWREFSPLHNIASYKKHPPTLVMLGDKDELIPVQTAQQYVDAIVKTGAASKLVVYENELHGFFNKNRFVETLLDTHIFLYQLGFTSYPPTKHDEAK